MKDEMITLYFNCVQCDEDCDIQVYEGDYMNFEYGNELIQNCFPYLSADERESIRTCLCKDCIKKLYGF